MSDKIFRGHADRCARCVDGPAYRTTLGVFDGASEYYLCLDCRDEWAGFVETDPVFREFNYVHEPYVMLKRRGVTTEEAVGLADNPDMKKLIDCIFEVRRRLRLRARAWVQGKPGF